jgi:hypothetical protein
MTLKLIVAIDLDYFKRFGDYKKKTTRMFEYFINYFLSLSLKKKIKNKIHSYSKIIKISPFSPIYLYFFFKII